MLLRAGLYMPTAALMVGLTPAAIVGYGGNSAGNPATPAGSIGDYLVAFGQRSSTTPPSEDTGNWGLLGTEVHSGISLSMAVYAKVAVGTAAGDDPITWTNATSLRGTWRISNGALDNINFSQGNNSVTIDYEAQPTMTPQSLILLAIAVNTAQTDIATALNGAGTTLNNLGMTQRAQRNTAISGWAGDGGANRFDSFDPADSTLDTSGNKIVAALSIKSAL